MSRRPFEVEGFIGPRAVLTPILREQDGSLSRNEPMSHSLVIGPSGIGKTELFGALARRARVNMAKLVATKKVCESLTGLKAGDFVVFDEGHNVSPEVQEMLYEVIDSVVPDGIRFAATINPAADGFDVDELDTATLARFVRVRVRPDRDGWLDWASKEQLDHRVIGYVGTDDTVFDSEVSNPRAWEMVSRLLTARPTVDVKSKAFQAAVAGCVGGKRAAVFCKFLTQGVHPLTADAILGADAGAGPTVRGWAKAGRLDLVEQSLLNVMKKVQSRKGYETVRHDGGAWAALGKFRAALPAEHREKMDEQFAEYGYELPGSNRPKGTKGGKS